MLDLVRDADIRIVAKLPDISCEDELHWQEGWDDVN